MAFFDQERQSRSYVLAAAASLAELRERGFPQIVYPTPFSPRTREAAAGPSWLDQLFERAARHAFAFGLVAGALLLVAVLVPAFVSIGRSGSATARVTVHSSAGETGTAATRVENLGVTTFVGQAPFVQHLRYLNALAGVAPEPAAFVQGAREATIASYVQDVGVQMTLPYLNETLEIKRALDAAAPAVGLAPAAFQQQATYQLAVSRPVFAAPALAAGTRMGATLTFYSCIGNGFCGLMSSGGQVFEGAAACSSDLPFGTRFVIASDPTARVFTCLDRGALSPTWVDVWFYDAADGWAWQAIVGTYSDIIIVE
jgi:hypothetical protein